RLVAAARAAGVRVEPIPGPYALVAALTASGLPTDEFHFIGFLPHKSGQRANRLRDLAALPGTLVLYESPFRIARLVAELAEHLPEREVVLARELTKKFEEWLRGRPADLAAQLAARPRKGEFVVLVGNSHMGHT
ncbi:MAG: 16S rRNA (cytidine(1402)-2'-O)-methyltransferase, partial [Verrucomicrobia bacterium]|nr:16S rRNA (cytidine(1402)-2'-O)-methyltransferase [Verrucomicrobiota bacterium]